MTALEDGTTVPGKQGIAPLEPPSETNPNGPGGKTQSYGQDDELGLADPVGDKFVHPGTACNPRNTFLPPNPNRDK